MACLVVPVAEAIVVTVVAQVIKSRAKSKVEVAVNHTAASTVADAVEQTTISWYRKLMWLARLLWGGTFLLAYEHVWHGEVVPWFPFLTGAVDPAETAAMLREMSTVGVAMAILATLIWAGIVLVTHAMIKGGTKTKVTVA